MEGRGGLFKIIIEVSLKLLNFLVILYRSALKSRLQPVPVFSQG